MVEVEINNKTINIKADKSEHKLYINDEAVSEELQNEFEEEILHKKISEASEEEINEKIQYMGKQLNDWVTKYSQAWLSWKDWAKNL